MIADPGTDLQHALIAEVEPERGQVLLTAGIVAEVGAVVKTCSAVLPKRRIRRRYRTLTRRNGTS